MHGVMVKEGKMEGERRQNEERGRGGYKKMGEMKWTTKMEATMGEGSYKRVKEGYGLLVLDQCEPL